MGVDVFSVPVFLVVLRETIEAGIIVSILFAFLKQMRQNNTLDAVSYNRLVKQASTLISTVTKVLLTYISGLGWLPPWLSPVLGDWRCYYRHLLSLQPKCLELSRIHLSRRLLPRGGSDNLSGWSCVSSNRQDAREMEGQDKRCVGQTADAGERCHGHC